MKFVVETETVTSKEYEVDIEVSDKVKELLADKDEDHVTERLMDMSKSEFNEFCDELIPKISKAIDGIPYYNGINYVGDTYIVRIEDDEGDVLIEQQEKFLNGF